ncbi:tellurite resistance protein teha [Anaeramoeba flamelloides]|uniref:Tellurite resistance protein teha n=1 Tax=Anaeramoeba flamelloides TaxID=1746091 RepID=A0ABQ8Y8X0_9EUKA|nr:tellurite resistance protein teha [Anaeramoeba flamelloides]
MRKQNQKQQFSSETGTSNCECSTSDVELNQHQSESSDSLSTKSQQKRLGGEQGKRKVKKGDQEANEQPRNYLQYFPISLMALVMGICGLALVFKKFALLFDVSKIYSQVIFFLAIGTFVIIAINYLAKCIKFKQAVVTEFNHPVAINFFPTFSISLLLFSLVLVTDHKTIATVLMAIGAVGQIPLTMFTLRKWLMLPFKREIFNATTMIPIVSLLLVSAPMGKLGYVEGAWLFFVFGMFFYFLIMVALFVRMLWAETLPKPLLPSLFIIMAPPAIGLVSYQGFKNEWTDISRILFGICITNFVVLLSLSHDIFKMQPSAAWLAFTFPMDALASAVLEWHAYHQSDVSKVIAYIFSFLALGAVGFVVLLIVSLLIKKRIFIPQNEKSKNWKDFLGKKKQTI